MRPWPVMYLQRLCSLVPRLRLGTHCLGGSASHSIEAPSNRFTLGNRITAIRRIRRSVLSCRHKNVRLSTASGLIREQTRSGPFASIKVQQGASHIYLPCSRREKSTESGRDGRSQDCSCQMLPPPSEARRKARSDGSERSS